ncbi:MAG: bifunctional riboflavin kinase/FAD synthetase [Armatimonadota bacterium]|nr:bifunctional riboflavin kinase/FAD synthetase [Armatimonadota bacterium]
MKVVYGLEAFEPSDRPVALALGTFDGVHRGHQAVLAALRTAAAADGGVAVATTFDPHPLVVLAGPREPFLLTTLEERLRLFARAGVDVALVVRFDEELRSLDASAWLERLRRHVGPRHLVTSTTHTFGRHREGTAEFLRAWGAAHGVAVTIVPLVEQDGVPISSSGIRTLLRAGDVRGAARWLGRWYSVRGVVVAGEGRGRRLGVPTANLDVPREKVVPARGVYAAYATVGEETVMAAVNVGVRPTFGGGTEGVEAHLLDVERDLYGHDLEVAFVERLRAEMHFPDVEALRRQIDLDVERARAILSSTNTVNIHQV